MKRSLLSRYLSLIDLEENVLLFSGISGNMDVVSRGFAAKLRAAMNGGALKFLSAGELAFFKKRGYVTELAPEAEREHFRKHIAARHSENMASARNSAILSLLFGYDCNLSCEYCYQKDLRPRKTGGRISPELLDLVFRKHFKALFPGVKPQDVLLSLYGGEPLQPANLPIIRRALAYAAEHGIKTSSISNGVAINAFSGLLGPLPGQINSVQVTVDSGDYKGAAQQRASGAKFDRIISSVHLMLEKNVSVSIRMHATGDNYPGLLELVEYLSAQDIVGHPNCFPHLAPVVDYTASNPEKFRRLIDPAHPVAREISRKFGYPLNSRISTMQQSLSAPGRRLNRTIYCMHSRPNAFILDPYGDLYGCLVEAGREEYRLGTVTGAGVKFTATHKRNLRRSVGAIKECLDCPYALLCGGSCPFHARLLRGDIFAPDCADNRESIAEAIRFSYLQSRRPKAAR